MRVACVQLGGAATAAVLALLMSAPINAADQSGVTTIAAEELGKRSKQPQTGKSGGMSESAVRLMVTYAFSLIPAETAGPDGERVAIDKSDPNKYLIPEQDARRVIRAATRSAYADVCGLPDLGQANYRTLMAQEQARKSWTREQVLMIEALHLFAVSYFTGNAKIIEEPAAPEATPVEGQTVAKAGESSAEAAKPRELAAPKPPKCPPEQKQKVQNAINAYVKAAQAN